MRRFHVFSYLYGTSPGFGIGRALGILALDAVIFLAIMAIAGALEDAHPNGPLYAFGLLISFFDIFLLPWALISILIRVVQGRPREAGGAWPGDLGDAAPPPNRRRGQPRGESEPPWT
jgi:hypothetical protein